MKVEWVNAFILATRDTFSKMVQLDVTAGKPYLFTESKNIKDISGMIGLAGTVKGAVVIGFSEETAVKVVNKFMAENFVHLGPEISDAVGELINIIAGYVKKFMPHEKFGISLPSMARGKKHTIYMPKDSPNIVIPFESQFGTFTLEAALAEGHDV